MVGQADESARQAAHASLQTDRLLSLLVQFQEDIDRSVLGIALDFGRLIGIELVEVVELVQAQDADFPGAFVEELAFVNQQFAADDFVARGGVAAEIDAPHVILLALVKLHGQIDALGLIVDLHLRFRHEVDEPVLAVDLGVLFHGLADFGGRENIALVKRENTLQRVYLQREGLVWVSAHDLECSHRVSFAFLDGNRDVHGLARRSAGKRDPVLPSFGIDIFENGVLYQHLEIPIVLVQAADPHFDVLDQFVVIVGF